MRSLDAAAEPKMHPRHDDATTLPRQSANMPRGLWPQRCDQSGGSLSAQDAPTEALFRIGWCSMDLARLFEQFEVRSE